MSQMHLSSKRRSRKGRTLTGEAPLEGYLLSMAFVTRPSSDMWRFIHRVEVAEMKPRFFQPTQR